MKKFQLPIDLADLPQSDLVGLGRTIEETHVMSHSAFGHWLHGVLAAEAARRREADPDKAAALVQMPVRDWTDVDVGEALNNVTILSFHQEQSAELSELIDELLLYVTATAAGRLGVEGFSDS